MCLRWPSNTFFFFTVSDGFCNNLRSILILSYCLMSSPTSCIVFKWQNYWNFLYSWKRNQEMLVNSKTEMYTFNFVLVLKILVKLVKCIGANIPLAPLFGVAILCNPGWSLVSCVSWGWLWMPHLSPSSSQVLMLQVCSAIRDYSWKKLTEGRQQPSPNLPVKALWKRVMVPCAASWDLSTWEATAEREQGHSQPIDNSMYNNIYDLYIILLLKMFLLYLLGEIGHSGTIVCMGIEATWGN